MKTKTLLFIPVLLTLLLSISWASLEMATFFLVRAPMLMPKLMISSGFVIWALVISIFFAARRFSFEQILFGLLKGMAILLVLMMGLIPLNHYGVAWAVPCFYIAVKGVFSIQLFSLLVWGWINQRADWKMGVSYYLPLAFVLSFCIFVVGHLKRLVFSQIPHLIAENQTLVWALLVGIALCGFLLAWFIFFSQEKSKEEKPKPQKPFPYLASAYFFAAITLALGFVVGVIRTQIVVSENYSLFDLYQVANQMGKWIIGLILVILGSYFLQKKKWGKVALYSTCFLAAIALLFALSMLTSAQPFSFIESKKHLMVFLGGMVGLFRGSGTLLLFGLLQILYLSVAKSVRFKTKILTELIFGALIASIGPLGLQVMAMITGSLQGARNFAWPLFVVSFLLLPFAARSLGKYLKAQGYK